MNSYLKKTLIIGFAALMTYGLSTAQKKDQSNLSIQQNIPKASSYDIKNPPGLPTLESLISRIHFSPADSNLIREDRLYAKIYLRIDVTRSSTLEDSVSTSLQNTSYSFFRDGISHESHNIRYFKSRYASILDKIDESYKDRFYSMAKGQYHKVKEDSVEIDYKDYYK